MQSYIYNMHLPWDYWVDNLLDHMLMTEVHENKPETVLPGVPAVMPTRAQEDIIVHLDPNMEAR